MTRMCNFYDRKIASIQAKRIYNYLHTVWQKVHDGTVTTEDIDEVVDSFTFFTDIIHLLDDGPQVIDVTNKFTGQETRKGDTNGI